TLWWRWAATARSTCTATTAAIAGLRPLGIHAEFRQRSIVVVGCSVIDPLAYVAKHVIKTPGIRLLQAHRMRLVVRVIGEPGIVAQGSSRDRGSARSSRVFPLRFSRQSVFVAVVSRVEFIEERVNLVFVHAVHWIA